MRRRAWCLSLAGALVVGCQKEPTTAGANDVRFDLSVQASGASGSVLHITVVYLDQPATTDSLVPVMLLDQRINVAAGTQSLPLTIDLTRCLADPRHVSGSTCELFAGVVLEQNGQTVDSVGVGPVSVTPGQVVHANASLVPVGKVDVFPTSASLTVGAITVLKDSVFSPNNTYLPNGTVTWASADSTIARVNASGAVTGVSAGTTTVTASAGGQSGFATITVSPVSAADTIVINVPGGGSGISFSAQAGSTVPGRAPLEITSKNPATVISGLTSSITYTTGQPQGWLVANVSDSVSYFFGQRISGSQIRRQTSGSGFVTTGVVDIVPTTTNLTTGTYTATVTVSGTNATSARVTVTYTITAATPGLTLSPDTLTFNVYGSGTTLPTAQTVTGSAGGLVLTGSTYGLGATGYLNVTLTGGTSFGVNMTKSSLPLGPITASLTIQDSQGATATLFVKVNVSATFAKLTAGGAFTCGVTTASTVYCWGDNTYGQIGLGTTGGQYATPQLTQLPGVTVIDVTAGYLYACAIASTHAVYCWGDNSHGELGIGTSGGSVATPTVIPGYQASQLALGVYHTCAVGYPTVAPYGAGISCWGDNDYGEFGTGSADASSHPSPVSTGRTFASLTSGSYHTCGISDTNAPTVYCWGFNGTGQLGIDSTGTQYPAVHTVGAYHLVAASGAHTCTVDANANVWCAGDNFYGELGFGNFNTPAYNLVQIPNLQADSIDAGYWHTCALRANVAKCWGFDSAGALGIGQTNDSVATPTAVAGGLSFAALTLSAAGYHTCGLTTSGAAYCWGYGFYGQLGTGGTSNQSTPVAVIGQPAAAVVTPTRVITKRPTARRQVRK